MPEAENKLPAPLELIHPRSLKHRAEQLQGLIRSRLWVQIIVAMVLGIALGVGFGPTTGLLPTKWAYALGEWLALPGYFFLGFIQMIVVPLVFASIVRGIASNNNLDQLKKTGLWLVVYFLLTTAIAVMLGIGTGKLVQPGQFIDSATIEALLSEDTSVQDVEITAGPATKEKDDNTLAAIPKGIVSMLPDNPLSAMANADMLQIVIFAFVFGLALVALPPSTSKPLLDFLGSMEAVCMTVVRWVMVIAPLAVFGLLARTTLHTGLNVLVGLGIFVLTVLGGFVLLMLFYLLLVTVLGRRNPFTFLQKVAEVQLMAFSTNSSAAVMPLTLKTAEDKLGIRPSTAQFVVPIGATVNMAGSALYHGLATLFMAQLFDIGLDLPTLIALVITIIGASIGTPATPGVGIIVLSTVLGSAGVPLAGISLIIGVDRILEMMRTLLNVTGDLVGCVVMDRFISIETSKEEESEQEAAREALRAEQGHDTLADAH